METINHEYYVSLEVAKLLKEAGFDWEISDRWDYCKPIDEWSLRHWPEKPINWNSKDYNYDCSAPTLDVAQRWLREVKKFHICVSFLFANDHKYYTYVSYPSDKGRLECNGGWIEKEFNTYEEAQEAGIKKALELILEKGE